MTKDHLPNDQEIAEQKSETYQALSSFHETRATKDPDNQSLFDDYEEEDDLNLAEYWECKDGAIAYAVPMDPAAGLKKGIVSKPYKSTVQIQMNINRSSRGELQRSGIRLVESIHFANTDESEASMPFVRSIPLDSNMDVDAADGTYSLDVSAPSSGSHLPLLPPSMLAGLNPSLIKFVVEHTIAISDSERCRCFFVYGDADRDGAKEESEFDDQDNDEDEEGNTSVDRNYRLLRVVVADEKKKLPDNLKPIQDTSSLLNKNEPAETQSPLDLLRVDADELKSMSDEEKMDRLYKAIGKHNEQVMASGEENKTEEADQQTMVPYSPSMFSISSGVYLGDTFIREPLSEASKSQSRGFGKLKSRRDRDDKNEEDNFANWSLGVQKTTLQFQWDYASSVVQSFTYGKCLGAFNKVKCNAMDRSVGNIVVDEGRAMKSREERRVIWYLDGAYLAGLIGTNYFRVRSLGHFRFHLMSCSFFDLTLYSQLYSIKITRRHATCRSLNHN